MNKYQQATTIGELTDAELDSVVGGTSVIDGIKGAVTAAASAVGDAITRVENMICPLCNQH
jgi:alcohol dehydrogenase YqhD (iron-dependent ADH family)